MTSITSTDTKTLLIKWTPRAIVVILGGYYGLGIAYDFGLMAMIDKIAIPIIKHNFGYVGVGAFLPTFQWYSAWIFRITVGTIAGVIYDQLERIVLSCLIQMKPPQAPNIQYQATKPGI